jgi:hypothetical protein
MTGCSEYCQIVIDLSLEHVLSKMSYTQVPQECSLRVLCPNPWLGADRKLTFENNHSFDQALVQFKDRMLCQ